MKQVAPHLHLASRAIISNVWLLDDGRGGRFLVDTGFWMERPLLKRQLWAAGVRGKGDLTAILLTHRHSDHAGNAAWLRETYGAPVICHELDAVFLRGHRKPPRLGGRGRAQLHEEALCVFEDRKPSLCAIDETYEEGAWRWGFSIVPTPGHTEGSVMLWHEPTGTLFSGDSILAGPPPSRFIEFPYLAVKGFSLDVERCHRAVREFLRELPPVEVMASGHGPAITKDVVEKLRKL